MSDSVIVQEPERLEDASAKWPTWLGVFSIVYALLGAVMISLWGAAAIFSGSLMQSLMQVDVTMPRIMTITIVAMIAVSLVLAAILFAAGIGMTRRRRSGVKLARAWVVLRILTALVALASTPFTTETSITWEKELETKMLERAAQRGETIPIPQRTDDERRRRAYIMTAVMTAISLAYPFVLGWWLARPSVRRETDQW